MVKPVPPERVAVTHPSGRPTVLVSPRRADKLVERGYTRAGASITRKDGTEPLNRRALNARAKELGVPAQGTNEALAAAIAEAEAATSSTGDD